MKKTLFFVAVIVIFISVPVNEVAASCYTHIPNYSGYKHAYNISGQIQIRHQYYQQGSYNYASRINRAGQEWNRKFSWIKFSQVSSHPSVSIFSDSYGNVGWVGRAYYTRSPKQILLNEWYHRNLNHYDFVAYERTTIHEYGHLFGLSHTSCIPEIMSNNSRRDINQINLGPGDQRGIRNFYY